MTYISEFIVESIDKSDKAWKFFNNMQELDNGEIRTLDGDASKKFTSLATNATIYRWDFGDGTTIETTVNPYIHTYPRSGTYSVSHQSCYPCPSTGTLTCSSGWCTKSIGVGIIPISIILNIQPPYNCFYPCSISATVTWQNLDDSAEYIFRPAIIIDGTDTISYSADVTIFATDIISVIIDIPSQSLPGGNHTICPVPN